MCLGAAICAVPQEKGKGISALSEFAKKR